MVDLTYIQQVARVVKDENGKKFVQLPLKVWVEFVGQVEGWKPSLIEHILAVIKKWENMPGRRSEAMWDELDTVLRENGVTLFGNDNES